MSVLTSWSDLVGFEHLILRVQFRENNLQQNLLVHGSLGIKGLNI
jgi:hypothetical protein